MLTTNEAYKLFYDFFFRAINKVKDHIFEKMDGGENHERIPDKIDS